MLKYSWFDGIIVLVHGIGWNIDLIAGSFNYKFMRLRLKEKYLS